MAESGRAIELGGELLPVERRIIVHLDLERRAERAHRQGHDFPKPVEPRVNADERTKVMADLNALRLVREKPNGGFDLTVAGIIEATLVEKKII